MGLFSQFKRSYKNAGANISFFLHVVESLEHHYRLVESGPPDPAFYYNCTGLELHNFARKAKNDFLKVLNEDPAAYRSMIGLSEARWRLAIRTVINNYNAHRERLPEELYLLTRDALCLVIETAFNEFEDGDMASVFFVRGGDVRVDIVRRKPKIDVLSKYLGNANQQASPI